MDRRRLAYVELLPDERAESAIALLRRAVASFAARGVNAEPADRQRLRLRRPPLWPCLPSARAPAQPHSASPSAHEWESRALHQDRAHRMGLHPPLREQRGAGSGATALAQPLQLQATTRQPRPSASEFTAEQRADQLPAMAGRARTRRRPRRSCGACRAARDPTSGGAACARSLRPRRAPVRTGRRGGRRGRGSAAAPPLVPGGFDEQRAGVAVAGLVDRPWRRCSPLDCSLGTSPRIAPSRAGSSRCQPPSSTVSASAVSVETPRRQDRRATISRYGGAAATSAIVWSSLSRRAFASSTPP